MALSVGEGLGLQAKTKDYAQQFMQQNALRERKKAGQQKADDDELQKLENSFKIDPNTYHHAVMGNVTDIMTDTLNKIQQRYANRSNNSGDWIAGAEDDMRKAQVSLVPFAGLSKQYFEAEKTDKSKLSSEMTDTILPNLNKANRVEDLVS